MGDLGPDDPRGAPHAKEATEAQLKARGVSGQCEACGATTWVVNEDRSWLVTLTPAGATTNEGVPVHTMVCQHCGYVRLFHSRILHDPAPFDAKADG